MASRTKLEAQLNQILLFRRIGVGTLLCLFLCILLYLYDSFQNYVKSKIIDLPSYSQFDPKSSTYWSDRTQWNIDQTRQISSSPEKKAERLRILIYNDLKDAQNIPSPFDQIRAICDIALTMVGNDTDINIDYVVRNLEGGNFAAMVRARIVTALALMYLRLEDTTAAKVAIMDYNQICVIADLKFDAELNEMSFYSAVKSLACMRNTDGLRDLFGRNIEYAYRLGVSSRMRAFRIIAGEQARVGMERDAFATLRLIDDSSVEESRACQVVVFYLLRPRKIRPTEPDISPPQAEESPSPLPNPMIAQRVINELVMHVAAKDSLDDQVRLMLLIAGSRLMCDREIYMLFTEAVKTCPGLDDLVRRPVMNLLENPDSELIRTALGMSPLPKERKKVIDPAADDWNQSHNALAVDVLEIDPQLLESLTTQQIVRALTMTAQAYLFASRRRDAIKILKVSFEVAKRQTYPVDRLSNFLFIAEQQINAGDSDGARLSIREIGLPSENDFADDDAGVSSDSAQEQEREQEHRIYTDARLSQMGRLLVVNRFFEDASKTIQIIKSKQDRDNDNVFLATEFIRIRRQPDASAAIGLISEESARTDLEHRLALLSEDDYAAYLALNLPDPRRLNDDRGRYDTSVRLIRMGLYDAGERIAERIENTASRSEILSRIVREQMLLFNAYRSSENLHRVIRSDLFDWSSKTTEKIPDPMVKVGTYLVMLEAALNYSQEEGYIKRIEDLMEKAQLTCRRIPANQVGRPELLTRLIACQIAMVSGTLDRAKSWPLIDSASQSDEFQKIKSLFDEAKDSVNQTKNLVERGTALVNVACQAGRLGMTQIAIALLQEAESVVRDIPNKSEAISILLNMVPVQLGLGDATAAKNLCRTAFSITFDTLVDAPSESTEYVLQWRMRDSELDRVVRCQLEYGFFDDAAEHANRVMDPAIKDRLLRAVAYFYLDQKQFPAAEEAARRITIESIRRLVVRDVLFMKRHLEKSKVN